MQTSNASDFPQEWGHPACAAARRKDGEMIRREIEKRVRGDAATISVVAISRIHAQQTPGTLSYDPEDAEIVMGMIAEHNLTEEVEAGTAAKREAHVQEMAQFHGLKFDAIVPAAGANFLDTLTVGAEPDKTAAGKLDPGSIKNIALALRANGVTPWHNDFDHKDYLEGRDKKSARLTDATALDLKMQMHAVGLKISTEFCHETLAWLAQRNTRHPVRDYLDGLGKQDSKKRDKKGWDGKGRIDLLLPRYFGTDDTSYHRAIGAMFMIAAVRRVRRPGCKFDTMLVLEGPQGARKSTALRALASDSWFTDGMDVGSGAKETIELTCGKWIIETAELAGMSKRGVNEVKQALSKQSDNARLSYGRLATEVARQFVMAGTTNDTQYLRDKTGNRRFWCATVGTIDVDAIEHDRDQLWAEASVREASGERIYLTDREYDTAMKEQAMRVEDDPLDIALDEMLGGVKAGSVKKVDVYKALGHTPGRASAASIGGKVATWMKANGWEDGRVGGGDRERCFNKGACPPHLILSDDKDGWHFRTSKRALH